MGTWLLPGATEDDRPLLLLPAHSADPADSAHLADSVNPSDSSDPSVQADYHADPAADPYDPADEADLFNSAGPAAAAAPAVSLEETEEAAAAATVSTVAQPFENMEPGKQIITAVVRFYIFDKFNIKVAHHFVISRGWSTVGWSCTPDNICRRNDRRARRCDP